jgi:hypothetical protein
MRGQVRVIGTAAHPEKSSESDIFTDGINTHHNDTMTCTYG